MPEILSIVMLVKDRPRLTRQALESLEQNTRGTFNLTIVDDCSSPETNILCIGMALGRWHYVFNEKCLGPGPSRNAGIQASEQHFGRPGLLYSSDSDAYFLPGWDEALLTAWPFAASAGFKAIGGYCHSYQRPIRQFCANTGHPVSELAALGLLSWLMEWETWSKYGPFEPSPTINGSEDWAMSQKIRRDGGMVGVLAKPVIVNCGVTGSDGKLCPGAATLWDQEIPAGVVLL